VKAPHTRLTIVLVVAATTLALVQGPGPAAAAPIVPGACRHATAPAWFHRQVVRSIALSGDLRPAWASSPYLAKIVCWQGTLFRSGFAARGPNHVWHGIFAMTTQELQTIYGRWMTATRNDAYLSPACFVAGWSACAHTPLNRRVAQQIIAGLRWIRLNYGRPAAAWAFIQRTGRFTSYPRQGTDDVQVRDPFRLCPVAASVHYADDFGEFRNVGGYHPHWGNDVIAPTGRPIRAPFAGLAVAHSDNWFAGHYVTVTGPNGYVRNGHLSRFGRLGFVTAGTVIGYVGATGDAHGPHDHFEWHPWVVPSPLHRSPFGFSRIMDGVDPHPFLDRVCR
jgi:hypothetical protein